MTTEGLPGCGDCITSARPGWASDELGRIKPAERRRRPNRGRYMVGSAAGEVWLLCTVHARMRMRGEGAWAVEVDARLCITESGQISA